MTEPLKAGVGAPLLTLPGGVQLPQIGLGTWPLDDAQAAATVAQALELGYRLIDTAENYGNERGVGQGIARSGLARAQVFVTTKFNRQWHSRAGVRQACQASLERLRLDYLDLLLIHWPCPDQDRYVEAYEGLLELQQQGLVRAVGVSNFKPAHLQRLLDLGHCPALNQVQLSPYHARDDVIALHRQHGIVTQSWRPLGFGSGLLQEPAIAAIAASHGKTPAQIVLRWAVQQGFASIAKSADPQRLAQNLALFDFALSGADMAQLHALRRHDPDMLDADSFGH